MTEGGRPPGRAGLGMRDMIGAMVVLLAIVGVLAVVTRGCSFDPGAPSSNTDTAPSVDVSAKLHQAARSVAFPVRQPALPADWKANSSSTAGVGSADVVVRVGWLTPAERFVQLSQSGGDLADVLATEAGESDARAGSVEVAGTTWQTYPARRDEVAWVTELDGVVTLITGSGSPAEFTRLAEAVQQASPLTP